MRYGFLASLIIAYYACFHFAIHALADSDLFRDTFHSSRVWLPAVATVMSIASVIGISFIFGMMLI